MFDIYVERFMYFLWTNFPLESLPVEITFFGGLIVVSFAAYVAFVATVTLWDKTKQCLNELAL